MDLHLRNFVDHVEFDSGLVDGGTPVDRHLIEDGLLGLLDIFLFRKDASQPENESSNTSKHYHCKEKNNIESVRYSVTLYN